MYSQNNEEQIIADYFQDRKGTFLEIGANDGKTLSNCYALALKGWAGVCVEPSPQVFDKLKNTYKHNDKIQCVKVAIGTENKMVKFFDSGSLLTADDKSLVSTILESETIRWKRNVSYKEIEVEQVDVKTLIEITGENTFDLISIDAEGLDYQILSQIDLNKVNCQMVVVEWNGKDKNLYTMYCESFGMKLIAENQENLIFVK